MSEPDPYPNTIKDEIDAAVSTTADATHARKVAYQRRYYYDNIERERSRALQRYYDRKQRQQDAEATALAAGAPPTRRPRGRPRQYDGNPTTTTPPTPSSPIQDL